MIGWLVPLAVFNTVVLPINQELGSIPRRSRKLLKHLVRNKMNKKQKLVLKKHRKNKERMKELKKASLAKSSSKTDTATKKTPAKKTATKKTPAKK